MRRRNGKWFQRNRTVVVAPVSSSLTFNWKIAPRKTKARCRKFFVFVSFATWRCYEEIWGWRVCAGAGSMRAIDVDRGGGDGDGGRKFSLAVNEAIRKLLFRRDKCWPPIADEHWWNECDWRDLWSAWCLGDVSRRTTTTTTAEIHVIIFIS